MANGLGIPDEEALNIYTDSSCFPKENWVGGAGHEVTHSFSSPGWQSAISPAMELIALKIGLEEANLLFPELSHFNLVQIYSESKQITAFFKNI